jgi:hypothetical protein
MFFLIFFLFVGNPSSAAEHPKNFGTVKHLVGVARAGGELLKVGNEISRGTLIQTESKSVLKILLVDGRGAVQVGPNSKFVAEETNSSKISLLLQQGSLLSTLRKIITPKRTLQFEVKNQKVSMGVRGTTFYTSVSAIGDVYQCICEGEVESHWPQGKDKKVSKHHDHFRSFAAKDGSVLKDIGRDHSDGEIQALKSLL